MLLHCQGSVLLYNYRGYGSSGGRPSLDGVCLDAVAAYDYLSKTEHYEPAQIIAYGESFGSNRAAGHSMEGRRRRFAIRIFVPFKS